MIEISQDIRDKLTARLQKLAMRYAELDRMLTDPAIISDTPRYTELVREHGALRVFAQKRQELESALSRRREAEELLREADQEPELQGLANEEISQARNDETRLMEEVLRLLLSDEQEAQRSVILEIRSGTGGEEAALFAADLFRMYTHYAQRKGWQVEALDRSISERSGFKEIIFSVTGPGAWQKLRFESGGHRVQRVPLTESQGRIHTSMATVAVLPEAEELEVDIKPEDLEISFLRSQGPGGQNVNKVSSCVRILHKPTGIVVKCQEQPSQHKNRKLAMKILRARLYEEQQKEQKKARNVLRRSQVGSGERSERIRTYNFSHDRITDHRIGLDVFGIQQVLMGQCDRLFDALEEWDLRERISTLAEG
jgi:peptide chain release factor 1